MIRADIQMDDQRRSKGCGVVVFETIEGAQRAIEMYNGWEWSGRKLEVREVGIEFETTGGKCLCILSIFSIVRTADAGPLNGRPGVMGME